MNPYRDNVVTIETPRRPRKRLTAWRKIAGALLAVAAGNALLLCAAQGRAGWAIAACAASFVLGMIMAIAGRSRMPYTRLCALLWSRGDRFGATLLFFNVIEPRYSAKRIARNAAALAAAQVGMPKHRGF